MRRWIKSRWFLAVAAPALLLGLYAVAGFWGVPKLIRSQGVEYVRSELGKDLALGEIRFNPFKFELDVRDIAIADAGQRRPVVALSHLFADFQVSSLWQRSYVFRKVGLEGPYARAIIRPDGSLNLAELVPKSEDDAPMPDVWIEELAVNRGRVDFADHSRRLKPEKRLAPIEFTLRDFRTQAESGGFKLSLASEQGERFDWQGKLSLQPLASSGRFGVGQLQARTAYAFLSEELPFQLGSGRFDLAGSYTFAVAPKAGTQLDIALSQARATDLGLRARGVDRDWVSVPVLTLDNTRLSLAKQTVAIDALSIDGLKATLWMEANGTLNLERLFAASPPPVAAPVTTAAVAPTAEWQVSLGQLELRQGAIEFEDRSVKPAAKFKLAPLALTATGLGLDLTRPVPISLQATINGRAPVSISGDVVPATTAASLQVELAKLPLRDLMAYLPNYPKLSLRSGEVGANGRLVLLPAEAPGAALSFNGAATVTNFNLVESADQSDFLSWQRLHAEGVRYTQAPDALSIERIDARKPQVRVIIAPDQSLNLTRALSTPAAATPAPASTSAEMPMRIGSIRLDGGAMAFADHSIEPNFQARIEALRGTITGFSTRADAVAKLDLDGQVINRYSPVSIQGETRPAAYDRHTDITMAFKNIELPLFNPYSGRFAGYAIAKGKLSTELHYQIDDRKLAATHHVILDQLEWGQATDSKDKVSLPIRLATSLLKDRHGVIDLNLPIAGTLDDPKFRVGPIVWQIIKNIVVKVVTAPFDFLGSLFAGAEKAQFVAFAPGSAELGEEARASLGALAKGLADRPALKIEVPTGAAVPADPDALAEQRLQQALAALGGKDSEAALPALATLEPERQVELLSKLYKQLVGAKPKVPETAPAEVAEDTTRKEKRVLREQGAAAWLRGELLARFKAGDGELGALGQARAHAIQEALLAGGALDPARVFVTAAGKPTTVQDGVVRLELGLE